jgi:hypothetical protein
MRGNPTEGRNANAAITPNDKGDRILGSIIKCRVCHNDISPWATKCQVCDTHYYPNVTLAALPEECAELHKRYDKTRKEIATRGLDKIADQFEQSVNNSFAVICVKFSELERLVSSESELKSTYYTLADTRVPRAAPPVGVDWNAFREVVDAGLFREEAKREMHFAALATSAVGPTAYGPCTLICATKYIEKRASTFEKNSCQFFIERGGVVPEPDKIPKGYRSTWAERGKLALAKLGMRLVAGMTSEQFAPLLLHAGATTAEDDFVEVHICGAMSAMTFEEVKIDEQAAKKRYASAFLNDLLKNLGNLGLLKD